MKIMGKYMGEYQFANFAVGGYCAFDADWVHAEIYSGVSVGEDERCFLKLGASYLITTIRKKNGDYLELDMANQLVREIASKKVVDLEAYDMGFYRIWDIRPDDSNDYEEDDYYDDEMLE